MVVRARVFLLIRGIIALNWLLGKLTLLLAQESVIAMATLVNGNTIIIRDNYCHLDDVFDNEENTRESLSTWHKRVYIEDNNAR
jgi:hypothetical protein